MVLEIPSLLTWLLVGLLTGALGTEFLRTRGYGQGGDIVIGILGSLAGGIAASLLGITGQSGLLATTAAAFIGAVLLTRLGRVPQIWEYVWRAHRT